MKPQQQKEKFTLIMWTVAVRHKWGHQGPNHFIWWQFNLGNWKQCFFLWSTDKGWVGTTKASLFSLSGPETIRVTRQHYDAVYTNCCMRAVDTNTHFIFVLDSCHKMVQTKLKERKEKLEQTIKWVNIIPLLTIAAVILYQIIYYIIQDYKIMLIIMWKW